MRVLILDHALGLLDLACERLHIAVGAAGEPRMREIFPHNVCNGSTFSSGTTFLASEGAS